MLRAGLCLLSFGILVAQQSPNGALTGAVKDAATGAPLPECPFLFSGSGSLTSPRLNSDGRYFLHDLPPGAYLVHSQCPGHAPLLRTVHIDAGQQLTLDLLLSGLPTFSGRVLDENNRPVANARVWAIQSEYRAGALRHSSIGPRVTGKDGGYLFQSDLEADRTYYLVAEPPAGKVAAARDEIPTPTYYGDATSLPLAAPVIGQPGERRQGLEIKLRNSPAFCVDGQLLVSGVPALRGLAVFEAALAGTILVRAKTYSAEDGAFRVCGLTPGQYRIAPVSSETGGAAEFTVSNADVHHLLVTSASVPVRLQFASDRQLDQTSRAEAVEPVATFQIGSTNSLTILNGPSDRRISVNLTGTPDGAQRARAEFPPYDGPLGTPLPAGDYAVEVRVPPGSYQKRLTYDGVEINGGLIHLAADSHGTLRLEIAHDGAAVDVTVADGASATVVLIPENALTLREIASTMQLCQADQNGTCTWTALAPGTYRLLAIARTLRTAPDDINKLAASLSRSQRVQLLPNTAIQLNIKPLTID